MSLLMYFLLLCNLTTSDTAVFDHYTTPDLQVYVDSFYTDCNRFPESSLMCRIGRSFVRYVIRWDNFDNWDDHTSDDRVIGVCTSGIGYSRNVYISKDITDPVILKALVYHELGHCILHRWHTKESCDSIMVPVMKESKYYTDNWDKLTKELFTGDSNDE